MGTCTSQSRSKCLAYVAAVWPVRRERCTAAVNGTMAIRLSHLMLRNRILSLPLDHGRIGYESSAPQRSRSEEHTSELQSLMRISSAVFGLKKKKTYTQATSCP